MSPALQLPRHAAHFCSCLKAMVLECKGSSFEIPSLPGYVPKIRDPQSKDLLGFLQSVLGDIGTLIWVDIPQESSLRQILNSQLRHMIHAASLIPNKLNGEVHGRNPSFAQVHTFTEEMMTNSYIMRFIGKKNNHDEIQQESK